MKKLILSSIFSAVFLSFLFVPAFQQLAFVSAAWLWIGTALVLFVFGGILVSPELKEKIKNEKDSMIGMWKTHPVKTAYYTTIQGAYVIGAALGGFYITTIIYLTGCVLWHMIAAANPEEI